MIKMADVHSSITANVTIYGTQGHVALPSPCTKPIHMYISPFIHELVNTVWDNGNESIFPATYHAKLPILIVELAVIMRSPR